MAYEHIRTLIGLSDPALRSAVKVALVAKGFRALMEVDSVAAMTGQIGQGGVDLVIAGMQLDGQDVTGVVREVRWQHLGNNPFIVFVLVVADKNPERLNAAIDCGVDDLVLSSAAEVQLPSRVEAFGRDRKPFVICNDYVGPDRRKEHRPGSQPPTTIDTPNPVRLRSDPIIDDMRYDSAIRVGSGALKRALITVGARQMKWLADKIVAEVVDKSVPEANVGAAITRLVSVGQYLGKRLGHDIHTAQADAIADLTVLGRAIQANPRAAVDQIHKMRSLVDRVTRQIIFD